MVAIAAVFAVWAILFIVRRLFPGTCCQTDRCAHRPVIEKHE
jgi:hypothetical protein